MTAIFFALVSYVGWGSGDIFSAKASRKIGAFLTSFWTYIIGFLFMSLFVPFALKTPVNFSSEILFISIVLGVILWIAWPIFNEALRIGNASIVGTIAGSFGGLVVILSLIFFKESLGPVQLLAIIIILVGIILSSLNFADLKNKKFIENKGTMFAIIVMVIWGIYFTFIRIPTDQIGWFWTTYIAFATGAIISIALSIIKRKEFKKISPKNYLNLGMSAVLTTTGTVSFNFAITQGLTAVVAPIATSYPTLFVLLSRFVFGDKLTKQQWAGIIISLAGIVLLAIFS